jgi:hypothetical protein
LCRYAAGNEIYRQPAGDGPEQPQLSMFEVGTVHTLNPVKSS